MKYNFSEIVDQFKDKKILIIGDAMLDWYVRGNANRICREAPAPIVTVKEQSHVPGGAANAAVNVAMLAGESFFLSAVGQDIEGNFLRKSLMKKSVDISRIIASENRSTLTKKRVIAGPQLLVRFDYGTTTNLTGKEEAYMIKNLIHLYPNVDAVIISDYGYGILTEGIIKTLQKLQRKYRKILVVDSKHADRYKNLHATLIKPNFQETVALLGITNPAEREKRIDQITQYKKKLLKTTGASTVAVTLDTDGAILFDTKGNIYRTFATPVENSRAIGAGDTYVSAFTLSLASGSTIEQAAEIASAATQVVVKKDGTAYCTNEDLLDSWASQTKIIWRHDQLRNIVNLLKDQGKRIVFTNGCFDILHTGHVNYLNQAKNHGDILIVGVNADESIKKLKGPKRPINLLDDRIEVLTGLSSVNYVVPFEEMTPINLITIIQPHTFVKGGDYTRDTLPETSTVERYGGTVEIIPYLKGHSTTTIIRKIQTANNSPYNHAALE